MDAVQKMALVPYDMIQNTLGENRDSARLSTLLRPAPLQKVLTLDRRMTDTLNDQGMSEDEKANIYSQLLHELRHFKTKGQTLPVRIVGDNNKVVVRPPGVLENEILGSVPKSMINKTRQLMDKIKSIPSLEWNEQTGAVSIDGKVVEDSNLLDLVHDAIRPRKTVPDPPGWEAFSDALVKGGVPLEYINNPKRRNYILNRRGAHVVAVPKRKRQQSPDNNDSPILKPGRNKTRSRKSSSSINWAQLP
jgi:hypothetical protein